MPHVATTHPPDDTRPTLLIFTLGPEADRRRRGLLPTAAGGLEQAVLGACLSSALAAGRAAGCRLLVSSPAPLSLPADVDALPQPGRGFGDRLRQAVAQARVHASGPILVVPGDVPDLRTAHLESALAALRQDPRQLVLGPDRDGGIYLLGATGAIDGLIASTPWRQRGTRRALERACRVRGRAVVRLETLGDLDRRADLDRWLTRARRMPLARTLVASALWRDLVARLLRWFRSLHVTPRRPLAPVVVAIRPPWSRRGPPRP